MILCRLSQGIVDRRTGAYRHAHEGLLPLHDISHRDAVQDTPVCNAKKQRIEGSGLVRMVDGNGLCWKR